MRSRRWADVPGWDSRRRGAVLAQLRQRFGNACLDSETRNCLVDMLVAVPTQGLASRESRVLVLCGLVPLYGGLWIAFTSGDDRVMSFLGAAMCMSGALLVVPQLVALAARRLDDR